MTAPDKNTRAITAVIDVAFAVDLAARLVGALQLWYIVVMEQVAPPTCLFAQA